MLYGGRVSSDLKKFVASICQAYEACYEQTSIQTVECAAGQPLPPKWQDLIERSREQVTEERKSTSVQKA